jgi:hypothetical protein
LKFSSASSRPARHGIEYAPDQIDQARRILSTEAYETLSDHRHGAVQVLLYDQEQVTVSLTAHLEAAVWTADESVER